MFAHWNIIAKWSQRSEKTAEDERWWGQWQQRREEMQGMPLKSGERVQGDTFRKTKREGCRGQYNWRDTEGEEDEAAEWRMPTRSHHTSSSTRGPVKGMRSVNGWPRARGWGAPPKPRSARLPTPLYFWKHPLCKHFACKISALKSV